MTDHHLPVITCDPRRQFGRPCIAGTRITASTIAEMAWAGDTVDELVDSYEVDRLAILWCCAWWVREGNLPRKGRRQRRWHRWAEHAVYVLGGHSAASHSGELCDPDNFEA